MRKDCGNRQYLVVPLRRPAFFVFGLFFGYRCPARDTGQGGLGRTFGNSNVAHHHKLFFHCGIRSYTSYLQVAESTSNISKENFSEVKISQRSTAHTRSACPPANLTKSQLFCPTAGQQLQQIARVRVYANLIPVSVSTSHTYARIIHQRK